MSESSFISVINPEPKDKVKLGQRDMIYLGIRKTKDTHPLGISPIELANILDLPAPTVRKFLGEYVKLGFVSRKIIRSNRSLYVSLF